MWYDRVWCCAVVHVVWCVCVCLYVCVCVFKMAGLTEKRVQMYIPLFSSAGGTSLSVYVCVCVCAYVCVCVCGVVCVSL